MKNSLNFQTIASLGILAGLAIAPIQTHASHAWGGYHWARTTPQFTLKLGNNLTSTIWQNSLFQASNDWNAGATPLLTAIVAGQSNKRCSMVVGTTQVCNGSYGKNGWLGLATISITGGTHITQGSAKMNDTYFSMAKYNNLNEKQHVMCQEIAHTFGLDHQSTDGSSQDSCMDYFSNTGINASSTLSTKPNQHDFDLLALLYEHLDSTSTVASMSANATSTAEETDEPHNWGQLISQSENGRSSKYERSNNDGSVIITHVYWTQEAADHCPQCDHRFGHDE